MITVPMHCIGELGAVITAGGFVWYDQTRFVAVNYTCKVLSSSHMSYSEAPVIFNVFPGKRLARDSLPDLINIDVV